jgi:hypothetical protein
LDTRSTGNLYSQPGSDPDTLANVHAFHHKHAETGSQCHVHPYADPYPHTHAVGNAHTDEYAGPHGNKPSHGYGGSDPYHFTDSHSFTDPHGGTDPNGGAKQYPRPNRYGYGHTYEYGHGDRIANRYRVTDGDAHTNQYPYLYSNADRYGNHNSQSGVVWRQF